MAMERERQQNDSPVNGYLRDGSRKVGADHVADCSDLCVRVRVLVAVFRKTCGL